MKTGNLKSDLRKHSGLVEFINILFINFILIIFINLLIFLALNLIKPYKNSTFRIWPS